MLAILVVTVLAYLPALENGFTNWDDNSYVLENPLIRNLDWETCKALFVGPDKFFMGNFHPLTMLSLALDYQIAGFEPWIYHLTNLLLHLLSTALVFFLVHRMFSNVTLALIVAGLFGVHPIHVESVVWVSERKDVLYTTFYLAALLAYVRYLDEQRPRFYLLALFLFVSSLLAKGQAVALSVTLVAIDLFRERPLLDRKVILEKAPFFALSLGFGIVAIVAQQQSGAVAEGSTFDVSERLLFACYGFVQYLIKLLAPTDLAAIYPYPARIEGGLPLSFWFYPLPALAILAGFVLAVRRSKPVAFALAFFIINIFLVLQLLPVGNAIMADRYAYVPSIGFFLLIALGYRFAVQHRASMQTPLSVTLVVYLSVLAFGTHAQSQVWYSSITLWNDVITKYPGAVSAWNNRGAIRRKNKNFKGAIADYNQALRVDPEHAKAYNNRGACKFHLKDYTGAIADYDQAIRLKPGYTKAYRNRSNAHFYLGNFEQAIADLNVVLQHRPNDANALFNRGVNNLRLGRFTSAAADFKRAIERNPGNDKAYFYVALALERAGNLQAAVAAYDKAIKLKPRASELYFRRGLIRVKVGNNLSGCQDLRKADNFGFEAAEGALQQYCKLPAATTARTATQTGEAATRPAEQDQVQSANIERQRTSLN